jgi:WXG100 family type VII secretion target
MNHYIKISTESLKNDSNKITELALSAKKQLQAVYSEIEILDGMWDGPAKDVFLKQFDQDYELFKNLCRFVEVFADDMNNAALEYERCENNVKDAVKAIRV